MATYYVNTTMVGFLEDVDHDLSELDELTVNEMNEAKAYMDRLIRVSQISESIFIIFILVAVIVCLSDGTLWEVQTALFFRWTCLPDCAVPELDADYRRNNRRLS